MSRTNVLNTTTVNYLNRISGGGWFQGATFLHRWR